MSKDKVIQSNVNRSVQSRRLSVSLYYHLLLTLIYPTEIDETGTDRPSVIYSETRRQKVLIQLTTDFSTIFAYKNGNK